MKRKEADSAINLLLRHYWKQIKLEPVIAGLGLILPGIGMILIAYTPPLIVARLLSEFSSSNNQFELADSIPYVLAFFSVWAVGELLWRIAIHFLIIFEVNSARRLHQNAMHYLLAKDQSFFNDNFAGSLTKKTMAYAQRFEGVIDTLSFSIISNLIPLVFITYVLWQFSPWLAVALYVLLGSGIAIIVPFIRRRQKLVAAREDANNELSGYVADAITNMSVIHTFAHESNEVKRHRSHVNDYMSKAKKSYDYQNLRVDLITSPVYILTNTAGLIIALIVGQTNAANIETVFVTFSYYASFTQVLWQFNRIYRNLETQITDASKFTELLLDDPKIIDPAQPEPIHFQRGGIEFKNVTFDYPEGDMKDPLLKDFNLRIKPGEKVGLVGHSGGGKTTLTKLILRFMDIRDGQILIDGQDIRNVTQSGLRSRISYVPQEPLLFHRSLSDNISYGNPAASQREIEAISKQANAHDFISGLEHGYDTLVGERGVKLSGGQRQRIAIARAMLKNAPILLLDEATSALDSESEVHIQEALWRLMEGRTAIVIAHRLSTIQKMDRIIVLEDGSIAEEGSHKELIRKDGVYARLWSHQSGGFMVE